MQRYPGYPYYAQPPYYPYPPYIPPQQNPNATPFIPPSVEPSPDAQQPPPVTNTTKRKRHKRSATAPSQPTAPLKSALKKTAQTQEYIQPSIPQHVYPQAQQQVPLHRPRTMSNPNPPAANANGLPSDFQSIHIFISFQGSNEFTLEHAPDRAIQEIRTTIFSKWPGGIELDRFHGFKWLVRFRDAPWSMSGTHAPAAWRMIKDIFSLFAERGYMFQTSIDIGTMCPRLLFVTALTDELSFFFLAYFSKGRRQVTLISPPYAIREGILAQLKLYLPNQTPTVQNGLHQTLIIQYGSGTTNAESDLGQFLLLVLRSVSELGFQLETAIPMAPSVALGRLKFGTRRQLYVFKGRKSHMDTN